MSDFNLTISDDAWEETGDEPGSHLLACVHINGCPMHLEAVPAIDVPGGVEHDYPTQVLDAPEWIESALGESGDYDRLQTVTIRGRRYVLIATPYAD